MIPPFSDAPLRPLAAAPARERCTPCPTPPQVLEFWLASHRPERIIRLGEERAHLQEADHPPPSAERHEDRADYPPRSVAGIEIQRLYSPRRAEEPHGAAGGFRATRRAPRIAIAADCARSETKLERDSTEAGTELRSQRCRIRRGYVNRVATRLLGLVPELVYRWQGGADIRAGYLTLAASTADGSCAGTPILPAADTSRG